MLKVFSPLKEFLLPAKKFNLAAQISTVFSSDCHLHLFSTRKRAISPFRDRLL